LFPLFFHGHLLFSSFQLSLLPLVNVSGGFGMSAVAHPVRRRAHQVRYFTPWNLSFFTTGTPVFFCDSCALAEFFFFVGLFFRRGFSFLGTPGTMVHSRGRGGVRVLPLLTPLRFEEQGPRLHQVRLLFFICKNKPLYRKEGPPFWSFRSSLYFYASG